MTSSVFYKFKNSKEPERIVFEGTGISVFELKREIITASGLGDGSDFDLHLYPEDQPTQEYDDDTTFISRSSTVIASRRPAARGHGRAARYVSGRAPVRAIKKADPKPTLPSSTGGALTEQDREAAFLAESAAAWDVQKEALSHAKPVFRQKKPLNVPDHDPPPGYICYRCQTKGHWIQLCPTNNDPDFKPAARAKRTTGIPRSMLKKVEKPMDDEDARGVMLNADGEYVQVMTDTKAWEKFQEKNNAAKAQAANADAANEEVRARGIECPLDKRLFVNPVKTPCCGKAYCHDCIENALADGDLICPNCATGGVLIDDLVTDEDMVQKLKVYDAEKAREKLEKEQKAQESAKATAKPSTPPDNEETSFVQPTDEKAKAGEETQVGSNSPQPSNPSVSQSSSNVKSPLIAAAALTSSLTPAAGGNGSDTDTSSTSKKRKEAPTEIKPPTAPKAMRQQKEQQVRQTQGQGSTMEQEFIEAMKALKDNPIAGPSPAMPMNMPNNTMGMPPNNMNTNMNHMNGINGMNGMNNMNNMGQMNGMNGGFPGMSQWNNYNQSYMNNMGFNAGQQGWNNNGFPNHMGYGSMGQSNMNGMGGGYANGSWNQGYGNQIGFHNNGMGQGAGGSNFPNQQRNGFGEVAAPSGQDAYERKPLNPHRASNKRKPRAADFHYVG